MYDNSHYLHEKSQILYPACQVNLSGSKRELIWSNPAPTPLPVPPPRPPHPVARQCACNSRWSCSVSTILLHLMEKSRNIQRPPSPPSPRPTGGLPMRMQTHMLSFGVDDNHGILIPPPTSWLILYVGWVGVGWKRHCKTYRSLLS